MPKHFQLGLVPLASKPCTLASDGYVALNCVLHVQSSRNVEQFHVKIVIGLSLHEMIMPFHCISVSHRKFSSQNATISMVRIVFHTITSGRNVTDILNRSVPRMFHPRTWSASMHAQHADKSTVVQPLIVSCNVDVSKTGATLPRWHHDHAFDP